MKIKLLFMGLFLGTAFYASAEIISAEYRVLSQNIQCNPESNQNNLQRLVTQSQKLQIDVLALQEFCVSKNNPDFSQLGLLRQHFPYIYYLYTHDAYDKYQEYLVIASRTRPESAVEGYLPSSPLRRGYIGLKFSTMTIVNTHLSHQENPIYRRQQMEFLNRQFSGVESNVTLVGDFNAGPYAQESEIFWNAKWRPIFPYATYLDKKTQQRYFLDGFWVKGNTVRYNPQSYFFIPPVDSDHRGVAVSIITL